MAIAVDVERSLAAKSETLLPHLDERQRRLYLGSEARSLGHGGIAAVARAAGVSRQLVAAGVDELETGEQPLGRTRRVGGGRKRVTETDPGLRAALLSLVDPDSRGDPESPLRWTTKSTRRLAAELTRMGHPVSADTVAGLLKQENFSLQANAKTIEGKQHPDRDSQFRHINAAVKDHQEAGEPVISVDTKKKELIGAFANGGREYRPKGDPEKVRDHDFPDPELGKAIPYGVYDIAANTGWVNVGTDHDTAEFAVATIRTWWRKAGQATYPHARRLLITADAGGSNAYRTRLWKVELATLAAEIGLQITVCHFPPGTSKWNKIEHRLFSHITMNWRGRPLTSHEVIVQTIGATTTGAGLRVNAELDPGSYPKGIEVSDEQMADLPLTRHDFHPEWNYTLHPSPPNQPNDHGHPGVSADTATTHQPPDRTWLHAPALTGLAPAQWDALIDKISVARHAQREVHLHNRRGHRRRVTAGTGRKATLDLHDRVAITVLDLRFSMPKQVLEDLFNVSRTTINKVIKQTRPLLNLADHTPEPVDIRLTSPTDVKQLAANAGTPPPT